MTRIGDDERVLYHYPRRFRWRGPPTSVGLYVGRRKVGAILATHSGAWEAYVYGAFEPSSVHRRRCDAKRAVEVAAVNEEMRRAALRGGQ